MSILRTISIHEIPDFQQRSVDGVLLDVRTPAEYQGLHAKGAQNVPLSEIASSLVSERLDFTRETPLYLLCESGARAEIAAEHFANVAYSSVWVIAGGTRAWIAAGLPVIRGYRQVISLERQVRIGAGTFVLTGILLGMLINPLFLLFSGFVGAGLVFAGITGWCGLGLLLTRAPWNR